MKYLNKKKYCKIYPLENYCKKCNTPFIYDYFLFCYECDYIKSNNNGCEVCNHYKKKVSQECQCIYCNKIYNYEKLSI